MRIAVILALGSCICAGAMAQDSDQEIRVKFAIDGKTKPCENLKVTLRLDGHVIVPEHSAQGFLVPKVFRRKPSAWPDNKKANISIGCGQRTFEFSEHPGWVSAGDWEVGIAYPPYWFEQFRYTEAVEHGAWLDYLISECNGCAPGVITAVSHAIPPSALVSVLREEQPRASGERARDIAYELSVFKIDYRRNRDYLMAVLKSCLSAPQIRPEPQDDPCDGHLLDYVTNLYWRGDSQVLGPLLGSVDSDKDTVSEIGTFYSNLLERRSAEVLHGMRDLPPEKQRLICGLAGQDDLSMNGPKFDRVVDRLKADNSETADRCLRKVERAAGRSRR